MTIAELWASSDPAVWEKALADYEPLLRQNIELEMKLENMGTERLRKLSPKEWYAFLHDEYFVWKYTAKNRLTTSCHSLDRWVNKNGLTELDKVRQGLLSLEADPRIGHALKLVTKIGGIGVAGASGLLSLTYPEKFGTVDQFVVKALGQVPDLPEAEEVSVMVPANLSLTDGVVLIKILRRKAVEIGHGWTPRKVDKVLWAAGHGE